MSQTFYALVTDQSWQSLLLEEDRLLLSTLKFRDAEEFLEKWGRKSMFKREKEIPVAGIERIAHPERLPRRLHITAGGRKVFFDFRDSEALEEVARQLQAARQLTPATTNVRAFRAATPALIALALTLFFGFMAYMDARTLEAGGQIQVTGRRRWMKQLLVSLAESLGTQGTLIAFGALALVCLVFLACALRTPPREVVYS